MFIKLLPLIILSLLPSSSNSHRDLPNPLSLGGNYIQQGECPWLCPLFKKEPRRDLNYICGSSIITNQFVVTAAHCVRPKSSSQPFNVNELFLYSGLYDLNYKNDPQARLLHVLELKVHPSWDVATTRYDSDVALIRLKDLLEFSKLVQQVALPTESLVVTNVEGLIVGYGKSEREGDHDNRPKRIQIPIVDTETCYQNHEIFSFLKSRESFCAGKNGVTACNGDSGSSFYILKNQSPVLVGVISAGIISFAGECKDNVYVIITDVFKHVDWIKKEVGSGFLLATEKIIETGSVNFKQSEGLCEYIVDDGYRCTLRGVRSPTNDIQISQILGQHKPDKEDDDVNKLWIVEQEAKFIPDLSNVGNKFKRINDLRIWTSGLKYIERSKLAVFSRRLRVLDFFNNHIEEIPADAFADLAHLEELKILNNRVKQLPENLFVNLRNLKYFFAEFNEIEQLPAKIFDQTQIVVVSMKNNWLQKIFVDFRKLRTVNVIDFANNNCINKCLGHYCSQIAVGDFQNEIDQKCH